MNTNNIYANNPGGSFVTTAGAVENGRVRQATGKQNGRIDAGVGHREDSSTALLPTTTTLLKIHTMQCAHNSQGVSPKVLRTGLKTPQSDRPQTNRLVRKNSKERDAPWEPPRSFTLTRPREVKLEQGQENYKNSTVQYFGKMKAA